MRKADEAVQRGLQSEMADLEVWAKEIIEAASKHVVSAQMLPWWADKPIVCLHRDFYRIPMGWSESTLMNQISRANHAGQRFWLIRHSESGDISSKPCRMSGQSSDSK